MIERIEEQLGVYQRATATAQLDAAGVRSKLDALIASEESSRLEAKTGREELKRLRKDWMRMRDDLDGEKSKAARAKVGGSSEELRGGCASCQVAAGQASPAGGLQNSVVGVLGRLQMFGFAGCALCSRHTGLETVPRRSPSP